jgi:hypothetical protein
LGGDVKTPRLRRGFEFEVRDGNYFGLPPFCSSLAASFLGSELVGFWISFFASVVDRETFSPFDALTVHSLHEPRAIR